MATRIANSIQPSGSAAEGIQHLAFLLQKVVEQNAMVSQSLQRVHSQAPPAGTSQSVHTPHGRSRRRREASPQHQNDPREGYHQEQYRRLEPRRQDEFAVHRIDRDIPRREEYHQRRVNHPRDRYTDLDDDA